MSEDQREALLNAGVTLVHRRGFGATGVREIAASAGVPQGSFTNHFRSKDAFGVLVLERYAEALDEIMQETLGNEALAPRDRLSRYFDRVHVLVEAGRWEQGCLIVDLTAEAPMHSDLIRECLCRLLAAHTERFEAVLRLIAPDDAAAADDAAFILAAWHGTLLRMKTERSAAQLDRFRRVLARLWAHPDGSPAPA
jgi:TetR/AcrR family transcriptional regulator, transcriptional repressor for nem operon